jgi:hypothetical protein
VLLVEAVLTEDGGWEYYKRSDNYYTKLRIETSAYRGEVALRGDQLVGNLFALDRVVLTGPRGGLTPRPKPPPREARRLL